MKILVTGAAGMIGSHLSDRLLKMGHHVIGIDDLSFGSLNNLTNAISNSSFTFIKCDVIELIKEHFSDIDMIFHLASLKKAPYNTIPFSDILHKNHEMMKKIADLSIILEAPIIFTSSSDVYGNSKSFNESDELTTGPPTILRHSYALSKLYNEQFLLNLHSEGKIKCIIMRIFGCFSERSNRGWSGGNIPIFIEQAMHNQDITVHGDGLHTRSMCHVSDIIDDIISVIDKINKINGEIINIGTDEEISILDCAKMIISLCNSSSKIVFVDTKDIHGSQYKEIKRRFANTIKATRLLGYKKKMKLRESLVKVIKKWKK